MTSKRDDDHRGDDKEDVPLTFYPLNEVCADGSPAGYYTDYFDRTSTANKGNIDDDHQKHTVVFREGGAVFLSNHVNHERIFHSYSVRQNCLDKSPERRSYPAMQLKIQQVSTTTIDGLSRIVHKIFGWGMAQSMSLDYSVRDLKLFIRFGMSGNEPSLLMLTSWLLLVLVLARWPF